MSQACEHEASSPTADPTLTPNSVGPIPAAQNDPIEVPPVQVDAHEEEEVNIESSLADPPPAYGAVQGNVGDVLWGFINMAKNVVQHPDLSDFAKREIRACIARLENRDAHRGR